MGVIPTADTFLYIAIGFLIYWGGSLLVGWVKTSTQKRRAEVDETAALRRENRLLKESLHEHRVLMIKSGQWTQDILPSFIRE